jgi:hypothetical protein
LADPQRPGLILNAQEIAQALAGERQPQKTGNGWLTWCPAHNDDKTPSLSITKAANGKLLLNCFGGCRPEAVIAALKSLNLWPANGTVRPAGKGAMKEIPGGLTLDEFAKAKKLDPTFLAQHGLSQAQGKGGPYIVFAYRGVDGQNIPLAVRFRFSMAERPKSKTGGTPALYGLWRLCEFREGGELHLVEGESDTLTAWSYALPAVGIPGKTLLKTIDPTHFTGFHTLYVWQEPDAPELPGKVAALLPGLTVKALVPPEDIKDISEAHIKGLNVPGLMDQLKVKAQTVTSEPVPPPDPLDGTPYLIDRGCLAFLRQTKEGPIIAPLCNFVAQAQEEIVRDNGREQTREFIISGTLNTGQALPPVSVKASEFRGMAWASRTWGMKANLVAGQNAQDRVREAIQHLSRSAKERMVFTHTGWRKLNGIWCYLHGGGAIGGTQAMEVDLGSDLARYCLPDPGGPDEIREAAQASLRLMDIGPWEVTAPLLACVYLAPLADLLKLDFTLWLLGQSGALKSSLAALVMSHFGKFDRKTLPGQWSSTANALERRAFILKDALFVIDDYAPPHNAKSAHELEAKAHRVCRAAGNRAGRQRLTSDASERQTYDPRCLLLSTGEVLPTGQSLLARLFPVEVGKGQIDLARLSAAQGEKEVYPRVISAYLASLAPRLDETLEVVADLWAGYRVAAQAGRHSRVPEMIAWLAVGFELFTNFLADNGTITSDDAYDMQQRAWQVFMALGASHGKRIEGERPTLRFLNVLRELLVQGRVYIRNMAGQCPENWRELGWQDYDETAPGAEFIGWADDGVLYLMPDAAFRAVQETIRKQDEYLGLGKNSLLEALAKEGFIEPARNGENTQVKKIFGRSKRVICLYAKNL